MMDYSELDSPEPSRKKSKFSKKFRKEWMEEPIFKHWLQPIENCSDRCFCRVCQVALIAGHSELEKHASGKKHCEILSAMLADQNAEDHTSDYQFVSAVDDIDQSLDDRELAVEEVRPSNAVYHLSSGRMVALNVNLNDYHIKTEPIHQDYHIKTDSSSSNLKRSPSVTLAAPTLQRTAIERARSSMEQGRTSIERVRTAGDNRTVIDLGKPNILKKANKIGQSTPLKTVQQKHILQSNALPSSPDPQKLLRYMESESDDDDLDEMDNASQLLKEMRAELAYSEKKIIDQKKREAESRFDIRSNHNGMLEENRRHVAEKELEARLSMIEEERRQNMNIYKLRLIEMETRIQAAQMELQHSAEVHRMRMDCLKRKMADGKRTALSP